jgi:hypothetical protein
MDPISQEILSKVGINLTNNINASLLIKRDTLLDDTIYETIKPQLNDLKTIINSHNHTCLHKDADSSQKWPLINLVRQILHHYEYCMEPVRKCVSKNGVKIYTRYFLITPRKN